MKEGNESTMKEVHREKHKVICLVGSTQTRWRTRYRLVEVALTHLRYLVVTVVFFRDELPDFGKHRKLIESIHFQKIDMADAVVLIHKDALSKHSKIEIEYAKETGKPFYVFGSIEQIVKELEGLEL